MKNLEEPSSLLKKSFVIIGIWILGIFLISQFSSSKIFHSSEFSNLVSADVNSVSAWWPIPSAVVGGTQPFKAIVEGKPLADYNMFWQVDGGNYVQMSDNQADSPHKEAAVDVTGWNWNSSGIYTITFIAQDLQGKEIGRTSFPININNSTSTTSTNLMTSSTTEILSSSSPVSTPEASQMPIPTAETKTTIIQPPAAPSLEIIYPTSGALLSGTHTVKAIVKNYVSPYKMYWSVDGGQRNEMIDSNMSTQKQADIDFINWNWRDTGTYVITFSAIGSQGEVLAESSVTVSANPKITTVTTGPIVANTLQAAVQSVQTNTVKPAILTLATSTTTTPVTPTIVDSSGLLYVNPNSPALAQAALWKNSRPTDALIMKKIGSQSSATWYGEWNADVTLDVQKVVLNAKAQNAIPTLVAYNIPGRDCGGYSAGGVSGPSAYLSWIKKFSAGIGNNKAIVILEPDALSSMSCLSAAEESDRYSMLKSAVNILKANPQVRIYLDAGHAGWVDSNTMAKRLVWSGLSSASGFSLNVSNFMTTSDNSTYGHAISDKTGGAHFIIDTSRNGFGSNGEWCNPSGRAIGQSPTLSTGDSIIDAYLWVKPVGESDGNCNGGPSAGTWWPDYALDMAKRAGY